MRFYERCVLCASVTIPPNHPDGIANMKVNDQWERHGVNEVEMMS